MPFLVGLTHKTDEARELAAKLCRVNVYKDKVVAAPGAANVSGPSTSSASLAAAVTHAP